MLLQGLKNYFKSLKHFFTPLGTLCLGILLGVSVLIPAVISSVQGLTDELVRIAGDLSFDPEQFIDTAFNAALALDWNDPLTALNTVLSTDWLTDTFLGCTDALLGDVPALIDEATLAIEACIQGIVAGIFVFLFFVILGLIGGYFLLKAIIRHNIAKRAKWKYFLVAFLDALLSAALISVCAWLFTLWQPSVFLSTLIALFLFGFISLVEAYAVHGNKKIPVKKVVNLKNMLFLPLTNLIIFVISLVFTVIAIAITNAFVGIFIGITLIEIAFMVSGMNAEAYVKTAIEKLKPEETAEITEEAPTNEA